MHAWGVGPDGVQDFGDALVGGELGRGEQQPGQPVLTELGAWGACFQDAVGDQDEPVGG